MRRGEPYIAFDPNYEDRFEVRQYDYSRWRSDERVYVVLASGSREAVIAAHNLMLGFPGGNS